LRWQVMTVVQGGVASQSGTAFAYDSPIVFEVRLRAHLGSEWLIWLI
jgi:hypothetical protein